MIPDFRLRNLVLLLSAGAQVLSAAQAPRLFAPGSISSPAFESTPTFSPDGKTCYFLRFQVGMRHPTIVEARLEAGRWSAAKPVSFSGAHPDSSPALSPDGKRLFFASQRPLPGENKPSERWHIWFVESAPGGWGSPQPVGPPVLDKEKNQVSPSVSAKGTLYYAQEGKGWDIYRARFVDGKYAAPEPVRVNSPNNEEWVAVAPDESFLVYSSAGGAESGGEGDLYLDRDLNAPPKWEESKSLDSVNTARDESNPRLSPDGKTLFFARDGDVYEVELEAPDRPDPRWSARAPMLDPRVWPQAVVAGGRIYVYGGLTKMPAVNKTFEEYDPAADRWRKRADPPSNWANGALAAVKGRIYLLRRDAAGMAQYDPAGDTWSVRGEDAAGPVIHEGPPYTIRAVTAGDRVFTVKTCGAGGPVQCSFFAEFNIARMQWEERATMPFPAAQLVAFNGKIYALGGGRRASKVQEYDPATGKWSLKAELPVGRWETALAAWNGRIYAIGGHKVISGEPFDAVEEYDPAKDRWAEHRASRMHVWGAAAAVAGNRLFLIGGADFRGTPGRQVFEYGIGEAKSKTATKPGAAGGATTSSPGPRRRSPRPR